MRGFCLEVSGEYACFSRPEMKVERVSYDVITPSAARAIFDAILWKPAIRWKITRVEVLNPIRWFSVRRNEVGKVAARGSSGFFIEEERQQRAGLILRDVAYRLYAEFEFIPPEKRGTVINPVPEWLEDAEEREAFRQDEWRPDEKEAKYAAMFERRAKKGQYFHHPYLGTREFAADTCLVKNPERKSPRPISETRDLGWMFYDWDYSDPKEIRPLFFNAKMVEGVVRIPDINNREEVRG
ncbi:MAG: type I-C CRISPR-associated protein Cas5c [Planctomycetia bacterium]|nr:type I-C CRISPR-associated protein Cas5c [Planctomycetia bacterium]